MTNPLILTALYYANKCCFFVHSLWHFFSGVFCPTRPNLPYPAPYPHFKCFSVCTSSFFNSISLSIQLQDSTLTNFWTLEGVPNRHDGCSCRGVVTRFRKIPKALLIRNGKLRNFAYTFVTSFPTDRQMYRLRFL